MTNRSSCFSLLDGVQTGIQTETIITRDDTAIRLAKGKDSFGESNVDGSITVGLTRNGPLDRVVSVDYYTLDGTALADGCNRTIWKRSVRLFKEGQDTAQVVIPILDDTHQEGVETLNLHLVNAALKDRLH